LKAVSVDVNSVIANLTFDVAAAEASAAATVDFTLEAADGCPALDLRQPLDALGLDGSALPGDAFSHADLGGGDGAEMRVLDRHLAAGTLHRLEVAYRLGLPAAEGACPIVWSSGGVRFDVYMSDLKPGRYLEMWIPANLCHDRFDLTVSMSVVGTDAAHTVITNGAEASLGSNRWKIAYGSGATSLSPMLVLAPSAEVEVLTGAVSLPGRRRHLEVRTARHCEVEADLASCQADIAGWLAANAARYGRWAHGSRFTAVVWAPGRGMEYDGATTASVAALEHEVFHSWFGRGIKPARASDGWIDEAWTSWATTTRRGEEGRFAEVDLGLDEPPVLLYPPQPWSRYTPVESYREGARLFAGFARRLGGAGRLRSAMADWYQANAGGLVTTAGLERHLKGWADTDLRPWFARYVHGQG